MKLGVVITCHAAYLSLLPEAVAGWEAMRADLVAAVVVYDGCEEETLPVLPEGRALHATSQEIGRACRLSSTRWAVEVYMGGSSGWCWGVVVVFDSIMV